jgi:glutathione synthase/RimK-type ligase-like ATP-grasp enzyme
MEMDHARFEPVELPAGVLDRLQRLMAELGLVYGAIDMRRTPDGRYVFLEVNPAGQWLFVEERTGQAITEAVAEYLCSREADRGRSPRAPRKRRERSPMTPT